jgi:acyl-coenzyme A thioesterase PaaI-like protein
VGLPLSCDIQFLKGGEPGREAVARAQVVDTQGRIARVQVEISQDETLVIRLSEMVFLRSGTKG